MEIIRFETPVVVVGGGPGGSTCSHFLNQAGIAHLVLDKAQFPRDKICGDALSGKVFSVLRRLGTGLDEEVHAQMPGYRGSHGVRFTSPSGLVLDVPFKLNMSTVDHPPGYLCSRMAFDAFLWDRLPDTSGTRWAGAELKSIVRTEDGFLLRVLREGKPIEVACTYLVGADGDRSVVRKTLHEKAFRRDHYCAGLRCYYEGVEGFHSDSFIELHFLEELLPGYFWIFPMADGRANVGLGMLSSEVSKRKLNLRKLLEQAVSHPRFSARFSRAKAIEQPVGWGLPLGSAQGKISGDGYMLVGDAGSLIDPFTGEGIANAMIAGQHAAGTLEMAIKAGKRDAATLSEFDKRVYRRLGNELSISHRLQQLSRYPWLFNWVVKKAQGNRALRESLTGMFDDLTLRKRLKQPGFYLDLLFNRL